MVEAGTGVGKSFVASALAQKACREGYTAQYARTGRLLGELALARADGTYPQRLSALGRFDLLVLDDWGLVPLSAEGRRDLLEILDERYDRRSTLVASQLPVENWHAALADPTLADAILDRLVHNAYRIALQGESLRKQRAKSRATGERATPPAEASRDASEEEGAE